MNLHENKSLLNRYISLTAQKESLPRDVVEKDYYVTLVLKMIYQVDNDIVFIGGTSLSKCFNIINRFSEDVDLVSKITSRKGSQKHTQKIIEFLKNNWTWSYEENNKEFSDFKTMYLNYENEEQSALENRIKIELITFMDPFPIILIDIEPYILKYMTDEDKETYGVIKFKINTQEPFRTLFEKIILQKELYDSFLNNNEEADDQIKRARDYYDIHKLWQYYNNKFPFDDEMFITMLGSRKSNRRGRTSIYLENLNNNSLIDMYRKRNIRKQLEKIDKRKLSIQDLNCDDIEKSLKEIDDNLKRY